MPQCRLAKDHLLLSVVRTVLAFLVILQVTGCVPQTKFSKPNKTASLCSCDAPPMPHTYLLRFKRYDTRDTGKGLPAYFSNIAQAYKQFGFSKVLVSGFVDPSEAPVSRNTLAWERVEWATNQLVDAGIPRLSIKARIVPLDTQTGQAPPGAESSNLHRVVVIEGYPASG